MNEVETNGKNNGALNDGRSMNSIVPKFCLVFILNLPVPFYLGLGFGQKKDHIIEMLAGCLILLVGGSLLCWRYQRLGASLVAGGAADCFIANLADHPNGGRYHCACSCFTNIS